MYGSCGRYIAGVRCPVKTSPSQRDRVNHVIEQASELRDPLTNWRRAKFGSCDLKILVSLRYKSSRKTDQPISKSHSSLVQHGEHLPLLCWPQNCWYPLIRSSIAAVLSRCWNPSTGTILSSVSVRHGSTTLHPYKIQRWLLLVLSWFPTRPLCQIWKHTRKLQHNVWRLPASTMDLCQRNQCCWLTITKKLVFIDCLSHQ